VSRAILDSRNRQHYSSVVQVEWGFQQARHGNGGTRLFYRYQVLHLVHTKAGVQSFCNCDTIQCIPRHAPHLLGEPSDYGDEKKAHS
jgi:hypothetical protein